MFPGFEIPKYSPVSSAVLFGWFRSTLRLLPKSRHLDFGPGSKRDQSRPWPRRTGPCTPSSCDRAAQSHSARSSTLPSCPGATSVTIGQVRVAQRCPPATIRGAYWLVSVGYGCHARKPAHAVVSVPLSGTALGDLDDPNGRASVDRHDPGERANLRIPPPKADRQESTQPSRSEAPPIRRSWPEAEFPLCEPYTWDADLSSFRDELLPCLTGACPWRNRQGGLATVEIARPRRSSARSRATSPPRARTCGPSPRPRTP